MMYFRNSELARVYVPIPIKHINNCTSQHTNTVFLLKGSPSSLAVDYFSYGKTATYRENFQQISLKCIKQFKGCWNGSVGMLCWSLIISLLQLMACGILSVRVFHTASEKNVPIFLSNQAVSVLKQHQKTTYRALLSLANSSWATGVWPGFDWFLSQCLDQPIHEKNAWIDCHLHFSACWSESSQRCCWDANTAPLCPQAGQPFTQEWGTAKTQQPRVTSVPLCGPWARERVPCATLLLFFSIKWREKEPRYSTCSSPLPLQVWWRGEKPETTHLALNCVSCACALNQVFLQEMLPS